MARDASYDRFLTIFSPEGRLYQIEYATQAVRKCDTTSVSVRGTDCCVIVCQKKLEDARMNNKMIDQSSVTRLFKITPQVGCNVIGGIADGRSVVTVARKEAADFHYKNGFPMPVAMLAKRVADLAQINTQRAGRRTMGVDITFVSVDDEFGPQLFKVDPSGHYLGFKAVSSGKLSQECNSILERRLMEIEEGGEGAEAGGKKVGTGTLKQCVQLAIMTLQEAARVDFNHENLEIGVIRNGAAKFEKLTTEEIEQSLNEIAERD